MNKNKHPELVISFVGVTGGARKILSSGIQTCLFALGYGWSNRFASGRPDCTDKDALCINSHTWNPRDICYSDAPVKSYGRPQAVYNAATQYDEFLAAAQEALFIEQTIDGVKATITHDEVKLDATDLLTSVGEKAREIQKSNFGQ